MLTLSPPRRKVSRDPSASSRVSHSPRAEEVARTRPDCVCEISMLGCNRFKRCLGRMISCFQLNPLKVARPTSSTVRLLLVGEGVNEDVPGTDRQIGPVSLLQLPENTLQLGREEPR